ncbi:hypothetical protein HDU98_002533 [Podochytrium sp. JEL0797]|nr:hypothetical protein HDU98_002533 [Podochytrium sp. JEL0797]
MDILLQSVNNTTATLMGPSGLTTTQLFLANIINGLAVEVAVSSILTIMWRFLYRSDPQKKRDFKALIAFGLMMVGNLAALAYIGTNILFGGVVLKGSCVALAFVNTFTCHSFFMSFDLLILFKCYYISNKHIWVLRFGLLIFAHRFIWAVFDLCWSYGLWDDTAQVCYYIQNGITGLGYNIADILSDSMATLTAI